MLRSCLHLALLMFLATSLTGGENARGQNMVLSHMYGSGVHAYFSGDFQQATTDLTSAIDAGSKDPRTYYFRGLAAMRMGMEGNAQQDFKSGAQLEATSLERFYPVSRSLERVQGHDRIALERFRAQARAIAYQEKQKYEQARYERIRRAEETVLRAKPPSEPMPTEEPVAPEAPAPSKAAEPVDDPFGEAAPDKPAEKPAPPAAEEDPFGDSAPPAEEMPKEDAPPGAEAEPAPKQPETADDDPFADDPPAEKPAAEDDPFGG